MHKPQILVLIIGLLYHVSSYSTNALNVNAFCQHSITQYNIADGLLENNVLDIKQDRYGFIWIATTSGVNRYDGRKFLSYHKDSDNRLSNDNAQRLLWAADHNMWIATSDGLNIFRYDTDSMQVIKADGRSGLTTSDIVDFSPSHDEKGIWIATYDQGINYYNYALHTFSPFKLPDEIVDIHLCRIYEDSNNNLWIGTQNRGVYCYSLQYKNVRHYRTGRVDCIMEDSRGTIYIAAGRLFRILQGSDILQKVNFKNENRNDVRCVVEDEDGMLWIGGKSWLGYADVDANDVTGASYHINKVLQQGTYWGKDFSNVMSLYFDKDKNLWIGTYGHGLYMLSGKQSFFHSLTFNPLDNQSISGKKIQAIACNAQSGETVISIENVGIDVLGYDGKCIRRYLYADREKNGLSSAFITALMFDRKGNLWVGTTWNGIDILRKGAQRFEHLKGLPSRNIRTLMQSSDGKIWIGTEKGLHYCDERTMHCTSFQHISSYDVRTIVQTDTCSVWIGTYGSGLLHYNLFTHHLEPYVMEEKQGHYIWQMKAFGDSLCLSTRDGIYVFSVSKQKYVSKRDKSMGLVSDDFTTFEVNKSGNLWAASNNGISYITPDTAWTFSAAYGALQNHFFDSDYLHTDSCDWLYFCGYDGINVFPDRPVPHHSKTSSILIYSLKLFGNEVRPFQQVPYGNPLKESMINTREIELNYQQSSFTLEFVKPAYNHEPSHYIYTLKGCDTYWNELKNREIAFRNLPPGKYELYIQEKDTPEETARLSIVIRPPFWKTTGAYICYAIGFIITIYLLWRISIARMKMQHKLIIERNERQKEEEIYQAKMRFFTNISHEIKTPLTLILTPLENMEYKRYPEIANTLDLIVRNARKLQQIVNQLLDFRKAELSRMKLKVQYGNLTQYIQQISASFESLSNEKQINLSFKSSPLALNGWFDKDFIEKIMFNLLSNAYKFTPEGGDIAIELNLLKDAKESANDKVQLIVKDTGCGISKENQKHIFERFYQVENGMKNQHGSGIGLHLVYNLVILHQGTIRVNSEQGKGAAFIVEFPNNQSAYPIDCRENMYGEKKEETELLYVTEQAGEKKEITVLVVDDDTDMRTYIGSLLASRYHVLMAENGESALQSLGQNECDVVVSDIMMDGMDGLELCRNIKKNVETSHIPVILLTAKSSMESRIEGLENGADSYITKPFNSQHLFIRIEKLIETREIFKKKFYQMSGYNISHITTESADHKLLQEITNYIGLHLSEPDLNGDKIANEFCLSRMTLHRKLKALTGCSTTEYIKTIRLKEAAYQIEHSEKSISEICYEVGFTAPSHFSTSFTKQYGNSPSDYLKLTRKNN